MPTAAHFIYIPGMLLIGIVIGWILGSRAAADAYASELRKRGQIPNPKFQNPNPKASSDARRHSGVHAQPVPGGSGIRLAARNTQAAVVGFIVTDDFEIVFDTGRYSSQSG